jgi:hypothetical protein
MRELQFRTSFDFRATPDVDGFEGYASTWWTVDSYGTAFAPGAFRKTIKERKERIPVLWNHNPDAPIGRHLDLREDKHGLYANIGIADDGAEGSVLLKRLRFGVPLGMSFGFRTVKDRSATDDDQFDLSQMPNLKAGDVRVITETAYWESSPVTFPANDAATISAVRSDREIDALSSLLDALTSGTLDTDQRALVAQIVAAWGDGAGAGPDHSTPAEAQPTDDDRRAALGLLLAGSGLSLETMLCQASPS